MSTVLGPMYHWSPRSRLGGIRRFGLMPGKRNLHGPVLQPPRPADLDPDEPWEREFRQAGVCCSPSPTLAWAYSHGAWRSTGVFDLWEFGLEPTDDVMVLPQWGRHVVEVRVRNRIRKARLTWVAERTV